MNEANDNKTPEPLRGEAIPQLAHHTAQLIIDLISGGMVERDNYRHYAHVIPLPMGELAVGADQLDKTPGLLVRAVLVPDFNPINIHVLIYRASSPQNEAELYALREGAWISYLNQYATGVMGLARSYDPWDERIISTINDRMIVKGL